MKHTTKTGSLGMLIVAGALGALACNRPRSDVTERSSTHTPDPIPSTTAASAALAPWETIDEAFRACEGGCGTRVASSSEDVVIQPGAKPGQRTYCPVSGVVFTVTDSSPSKEVAGQTIYFCCAGCAQYFSANRDRVVALRQLGS